MISSSRLNPKFFIDKTVNLNKLTLQKLNINENVKKGITTDNNKIPEVSFEPIDPYSESKEKVLCFLNRRFFFLLLNI